MSRLALLAPATDLRELALPHLQDLVAATGHTVHLAVLDGASALVIERRAGVVLRDIGVRASERCGWYWTTTPPAL